MIKKVKFQKNQLIKIFKNGIPGREPMWWDDKERKPHHQVEGWGDNPLLLHPMRNPGFPFRLKKATS